MEFKDIKLISELNNKELGARIRKGRNLLGLTQTELSKKIGFSGRRITVYQWEHGTHRPTPPTITIINQIFESAIKTAEKKD